MGRFGAPLSFVLTVYAVPVSLYCAKLRILLRHKRLQWREIPPNGGYGSEAYRAIVPSGNLPALVDGDLLLADSEAIAEYLNEKYRDPPMLPDSIVGRARARERSRFHDTRLEPSVRVLFPYLTVEPPDQDVFDRQAAVITARLAQFARLIADDRNDPAVLALGDCGYPITFQWIAALNEIMELGSVWPDAVLAYAVKVRSHAAVASELAAYRPVLAEWLKTRGIKR